MIRLPEGISFPPEWVIEDDADWTVIRAPSRSNPGSFHHVMFYKRSREIECTCNHFRYYKDCFHLQTIRGYWAHPQKVGGLAETSLESFKLLTDDLLARENSKVLLALRIKGPMCNRKISEETGIIISSVTARIFELREDGFVRERCKQKDPKRLPIMQETEVHLAALQRSADVLRGLGYHVGLEVHSPEMQKVLPVVHVEDIEVSCNVERFQEVAAK